MNSSIMLEIEEFDLVINQIEKNMNKKFNYLKLLYKDQEMVKEWAI